MNELDTANGQLAALALDPQSADVEKQLAVFLDAVEEVAASLGLDGYILDRRQTGELVVLVAYGCTTQSPAMRARGADALVDAAPRGPQAAAPAASPLQPPQAGLRLRPRR